MLKISANVLPNASGMGADNIPDSVVRLRRVLIEHFGFDEETAEAFRLLMSASSIACRGKPKADLLSAYLFFRLAGGFVYGDTDDLMSDLKWGAVAGDLGTLFNAVSPGGSYDKQGFMEQVLGVSEGAYVRMRAMTRRQHDLCGQANNSDDDKNAQEDRMLVMPDFAHFCITTATALATDLFSLVAGNAAIAYLYSPVVEKYGCDVSREWMAGWLGDAVLFGDDENGKTTFGLDDFWADADALVVSGMLRAGGIDAAGALLEYYPLGASNTFGRRTVFLERLGFGVIVESVSLAILKISLPCEGLEQALATSDRYPDTIRFIEVMRGNTAEGEYHDGENRDWF